MGCQIMIYTILVVMSFIITLFPNIISSSTASSPADEGSITFEASIGGSIPIWTTLEANNDVVSYYISSGYPDPMYLPSVISMHIHQGEQGENGPVIVTLFDYGFPQELTWANGTITAENLKGPMAGGQISDLVKTMKNEETYVEIHTDRYPDLRIQISESFRVAL